MNDGRVVSKLYPLGEFIKPKRFQSDTKVSDSNIYMCVSVWYMEALWCERVVSHNRELDKDDKALSRKHQKRPAAAVGVQHSRRAKRLEQCCSSRHSSR